MLRVSNGIMSSVGAGPSSSAPRAARRGCHAARAARGAQKRRVF